MEEDYGVDVSNSENFSLDIPDEKFTPEVLNALGALFKATGNFNRALNALGDVRTQEANFIGLKKGYQRLQESLGLPFISEAEFKGIYDRNFMSEADAVKYINDFMASKNQQISALDAHMKSYYLTRWEPIDMYKAFMLSVNTLSELKFLLKRFGLTSSSLDIENIDNGYSVNIYLLENIPYSSLNENRIVPRQVSNVLGLKSFEQMLSECRTNLIKKGYLSTGNCSFDSSNLYNWQIELYNKFAKHQFTYKKMTDFFFDCIMMQIQFVKDIYDSNNGLTEIKKNSDYFERLISFELLKTGENDYSVENFYNAYQRALDKNDEWVVVELDSGETFTGKPLYSQFEQLHVIGIKSIVSTNEHIGNIRLLLENGEIVNIMSNTIAVVFPKSIY